MSNIVDKIQTVAWGVSSGVASYVSLNCLLLYQAYQSGLASKERKLVDALADSKTGLNHLSDIGLVMAGLAGLAGIMAIHYATKHSKNSKGD